MSHSFTLAASVDSAEKALKYLESNPADLVIMDIVMTEGKSGLNIAAEIKKNHPTVKILMVTSMPEVSFMERARAIGVESFWYKEVQEQPILEIMERTMRGESLYPDSAPVVVVGNAVSTEFTDREIAVRARTGGLVIPDV